jgi:predicted ester cyclase
MSSNQRGTTARRRQTARDNAAVVRRLLDEAGCAGRLDILDAVLAPDDCVAESAIDRAHGLDREGIKQALRLFRAAVPDACWTIQEQVAAGDTVVTRLQVQGTHRGGLWGIAPTGKRAAVTGVLICRFVRGRVASCWAQADLLGLLCQLGVLPAMDLEQVVAMARVLQTGQVWAGQEQGKG